MPDRRTRTFLFDSNDSAERLQGPQRPRRLSPIQAGFRRFATPSWTALPRSYSTARSSGAWSGSIDQRTAREVAPGSSCHDSSQDMTTATKLRLRFAKRGDLRLASHHDMMRCLERMVRRAQLPMRRAGVHTAAENCLRLAARTGDRGTERDRRYRAVRAQRTDGRVEQVGGSRSSRFPMAPSRGPAGGRTSTSAGGCRV